MKKISTYLLVLAAAITAVSCNDKNEDPIVESPAAPTITWESNPDFEKMDITDEMDVKITIDAPAGIKNFKVTVDSKPLNDNLGITEIDLIEPSEDVKKYADMIIGEAGSPKDKTTYTLDISKLVPMINALTTEESDHSFTVTVGDKNDKIATKTAVFHRVAMPKPTNDVLKVNMFTEFNVKSISNDKIVTFYDELSNEADESSYFSYQKLQEMELTKSDGNEIIKDGSGNKYRLPTAGELGLLFPMNEKTEEEGDALYPVWYESTEDKIAEIASTEGWYETLYLKNNDDCSPDKTTNQNENDGNYRISGKSWLKRSDNVEVYTDTYGDSYNLAPVYGLRFKGTSQYAAYRWEYGKINGNAEERCVFIKIKALGKNDETTTIDDVAKESFWESDYIEFKFPASGYFYPRSWGTGLMQQGKSRYGNCWSSTIVANRTSANALTFNVHQGEIAFSGLSTNYFPLRMVKVEE